MQLENIGSPLNYTHIPRALLLRTKRTAHTKINLLLSNGLNVLHKFLNLIVKSLLGFLLELVDLGLVVDVLGSDGSSGDLGSVR